MRARIVCHLLDAYLAGVVTYIAVGLTRGWF